MLKQAVLLFALSFQPVTAVFAVEVPALTSPVVDQANVLSGSDRQVLENFIREVNRQGRAQLQVLTLRSLEGTPIEAASIQIVDKWKLGDQKLDNGVLLLLVPSERQVRIEVGQGLEGDLPDVIVKRLIEDVIIPSAKKGDYASGLFTSLKFIGSILGVKSASVRSRGYRVGSEYSGLTLVLAIIFPLALLFSLWSSITRRQRIGGSVGGVFWEILVAILFRGGGGGFGGGRGGGWSGGGGGFSGGGASGRW